MKVFALSFAVKLRGSPMRKVMPVSLQSDDMMISYPLEFGKGPMKSKARDSKARVGTGSVFAVPPGLCVAYFET